MGGYFGLGTTLRLGRRTGVEAETANTGTDVATERRNPAAGADAVEAILARDANEHLSRAAPSTRVSTLPHINTSTGYLCFGVSLGVKAAILVGDAGAATGAATVLALVSADTGEGEH